MGSSMVEYVINQNNVIQQHCKPGKKKSFAVEDMFLGICNEKCHYVHDDMCPWPDFLGRNLVRSSPHFWYSLRCEHCNTEGNLQVFKTQKTREGNKELSEWSASPLEYCTYKMEPRKPECKKKIPLVLKVRRCSTC